ncbi:MAG TPA: ABC transporter ATP-binding protein [Firmicutes bacterium]|nr:ABC transporter ATP-binding protein [Bacillota bacterium]
MPEYGDTTGGPEVRGSEGLAALWALRPYLRPHRGRLVGAAILMLVSAGSTMFLPYASRIALDRYIIPHRPQGLLQFIALVVAIAAAGAVATAWRARLMAYTGQESIRAIRRALFAHLQRLPVSFFDRMPVGKVMTRLTSDVDALAELLSGTIIQMFGDVLTLVGFLAVMFAVDWRLALVTVAGVPPLVFAFTFLSAQIGRAEDTVRERAASVNATLQESVSGIRVIQAFWAHRRFGERFEQVNRSLFDASRRALLIFAFFWPIVDFTWVASTGLLLFAGGYWILQGTLTIGTLSAFMGYGGQFFGPLHSLSQAYRVIQRALAGAVRINQIMQTPGEQEAGRPEMPPIRGEVEFDHVTFGYEADRPVLRDISLRAKPGETVALVGHTGAGKTSVINLLCRFYHPQSGTIRVDGHDICRVDLDSYRRQIALVLQEPFLFSGTVRENLRYGNLAATEEQMRAALDAVGLNLPLDLVLHERGSNLSSGQRQLLSFARALLADPRILILDEATAHVDTLTERQVQAATERLLRGRTAFVIAHRLSTIRSASQILVIEDGHLVERGTHDELMAARGRYWRLCREQNLLPLETEGGESTDGTGSQDRTAGEGNLEALA